MLLEEKVRASIYIYTVLKAIINRECDFGDSHAPGDHMLSVVGAFVFSPI